MQINDLKTNTSRKKTSRVGRGGTRGKTSGRGHKGQKSRSGAGMRPNIRDEIKRIPKRRGHGKNRPRTVNPSRVKPTTINLATLEGIVSGGVKIVSPESLVKGGFIKKIGGMYPKIKILGNGEIKSKATVKLIEVSAAAKEKIEKAGGKVS